MYFNGPYLRVLTPRTTNGIVPDIQNGEVQYKESFLPLTAKKQLDKKNARLIKNGNKQLAAIIEVVGEEIKKPSPRPQKEVISHKVETDETFEPDTQGVEIGEPETVVEKTKRPNPRPKKGKIE